MSHLASSLPPVKLSLQGHYWDSQLYSGTLVLFCIDGSLLRVNWSQFINSLSLPDDLRLVSEAAFLGSDRFYTDDMRRLLQDPEVEPIMLGKFRRLQELTENWTLPAETQGHHLHNPLPFPHNDSEFYYGSLYVGARSGVFKLVGDSGRSRVRSSNRLTDAPALDIAIKHSSIALATGTDGLMEVRLQADESILAPIAPNPCNSCEWTYSSLVCSQQAQSLFVAAFARVLESSAASGGGARHYIRQFEGVLGDDELFRSFNVTRNDDSIEWGAKDKLYRLRGDQIDILRSSSNAHVVFERMDQRTISLDVSLETFVAVRVAPFGSVIEFDDRLVVLLNTGDVVTFPGEPVNWRIFPRSLNYLSQLHIVYEDHLDIVSFTNDYFVHPSARLFGTEPVSFDERFA